MGALGVIAAFFATLAFITSPIWVSALAKRRTAARTASRRDLELLRRAVNQLDRSLTDPSYALTSEYRDAAKVIVETFYKE